MKDDSSNLPAPTGAIDWASQSHVGAVVDHTGQFLVRYEFSHTAAGLAAMAAASSSTG